MLVRHCSSRSLELKQLLIECKIRPCVDTCVNSRRPHFTLYHCLADLLNNFLLSIKKYGKFVKLDIFDEDIDISFISKFENLSQVNSVQTLEKKKSYDILYYMHSENRERKGRTAKKIWLCELTTDLSSFSCSYNY